MADSLGTSSGQKVNADGSAFYQFDGRIIARGIDIEASPGAAPADENKVRWLSSAGGELTRVWTLEGNATHLVSEVLGGPQLRLESNGVLPDRIKLDTPDGSIAIEAGIQGRTLLNDAGASDFIQLQDLGRKSRIHGPYFAPFSLAAGGVAFIDVAVSTLGTVHNAFLGHLEANVGSDAWVEHVGWCIVAIGSSNVARVKVGLASGAAVGTLVFSILSID